MATSKCELSTSTQTEHSYTPYDVICDLGILLDFSLNKTQYMTEHAISTLNEFDKWNDDLTKQLDFVLSFKPSSSLTMTTATLSSLVFLHQRHKPYPQLYTLYRSLK